MFKLTLEWPLNVPDKVEEVIYSELYAIEEEANEKLRQVLSKYGMELDEPWLVRVIDRSKIEELERRLENEPISQDTSEYEDSD